SLPLEREDGCRDRRECDHPTKDENPPARPRLLECHRETGKHAAERRERKAEHREVAGVAFGVGDVQLVVLFRYLGLDLGRVDDGTAVLWISEERPERLDGRSKEVLRVWVQTIRTGDSHGLDLAQQSFRGRSGGLSNRHIVSLVGAESGEGPSGASQCEPSGL